MASLNPLKLAIFALVISGTVAIFGEAEMVIEEVIMEEPKIPEVVVVNDKVILGQLNQRCAPLGGYCEPRNPNCCENLSCVRIGSLGQCVQSNPN